MTPIFKTFVGPFEFGELWSVSNPISRSFPGKFEPNDRIITNKD